LKNPWTNQAFGICLEALIMALAVVSRARWLQNELTVRARQQTELIEAQNAMLEAKVQERTQELSAKHELVVSSVNYASRLQRGQLPRQIRTEGRFKSFASIWEPRDTIGGDLYWLSSSQQSGPFVLAVADCTGHGVPGAMLSLLVSNSLERIYAIDTAEDPAAALMSLDHYVRTGLNQDRAGSESDDGCDAAVLRIDRDKNTIEFAGAKLGLFQVNAQGVLTRHQAARCSLGYQDVVVEADKPVVKKISYQSGDVFAVVTDGFTDQIGGSTGKTSFGYRRLEDILKANYKASAEEITVAMRNEFAAWQGTNARRDDVTAVVFRL
jgi:serine phosphatase RsbU (regulator of sigma subunit)